MCLTEPTITECGSILKVSPNGTQTVPGWGPSCYISADDTANINTPCRELIQDLPGIGKMLHQLHGLWPSLEIPLHKLA
jgi:hypothetical protein